MRKTLMFALLLIPMLSYVALAEDLGRMMDRFYGGLADIFEANMDDPEQALSEVNNYFEENQVLIVQIQEGTKKAMAQAAPKIQSMLDKYKSMSEEELDALEGKQEKMQGSMGFQMSPTMARYNKAMQAFTMKHVQHAMKIHAKLMQLTPGAGQQMPMQMLVD